MDKVNDINKIACSGFSDNTEGFIDLFNDYNKLSVFVVSGIAESLRGAKGLAWPMNVRHP